MRLQDPSLFRERAFIDGAWSAADSGATLAVHNPATSEALGSVPNMGTAETRRAIDAAAKALPPWAARTAKDRAGVLRRWFDLILANQEDLAILMTAEQGKPLGNPRARSATPHPSSNGSPKRASAFMATSSPGTRATNGSWSCASRSASWPQSRRGIFRPR